MQPEEEPGPEIQAQVCGFHIVEILPSLMHIFQVGGIIMPQMDKKQKEKVRIQTLAYS